MPSGYLVDRFGARAPLAIGVLVWSVVSVATPLADTLAALVVIRLLLGISEAVVTLSLPKRTTIRASNQGSLIPNTL